MKALIPILFFRAFRSLDCTAIKKGEWEQIQHLPAFHISKTALSAVQEVKMCQALVGFSGKKSTQKQPRILCCSFCLAVLDLQYYVWSGKNRKLSVKRATLRWEDKEFGGSVFLFGCIYVVYLTCIHVSLKQHWYLLVTRSDFWVECREVQDIILR